MVTQRNIWLAEDDKALSETLSQVFGVYNQVSTVSTIFETRNLLQGASPSADLLLLDKTLEDGDSTVLLPEIRRLAPQMTVMLMSGDRDFYAIAQALGDGADDYVLKSPRLLEELQLRIPIAERTARARCQLGSTDALPVSPAELNSRAFVSYRASSERAFLERAMSLSNHDVTAVARRLGLGRSTVFRKVAELNISRGTSAGEEASYG